jgi:putative zinc finger protein/HEAT repeat protein
MTCDSVLKLIPLYSYGELTPEEEDRLDQHLHECASCNAEMDRQIALAAALDRRQTDAPSSLLEECRADLMAAIAGGAPRLERPAKGPWKLFLEALSGSFEDLVRFRQPVGALALVGLGFFAARIIPGGFQPVTANNPLSNADVFSTVRSVQPDPSGGVQISYDETRRQVISGSMEDRAIQKLLLAAAQEDNAAVRVESVGLLKSRAGSAAEVRDALINAIAHDPNAGVRIKALEGLKPLAGDPAVRKTLAQVLLTDDHAAVRMQVVDLLVSQRDDTLVGLFQGLVQKEDNNSVRLKVARALKEMNASVGTF